MQYHFKFSRHESATITRCGGTSSDTGMKNHRNVDDFDFIKLFLQIIVNNTIHSCEHSPKTTQNSLPAALPRTLNISEIYQPRNEAILA